MRPSAVTPAVFRTRRAARKRKLVLRDLPEAHGGLEKIKRRKTVERQSPAIDNRRSMLNRISRGL